MEASGAGLATGSEGGGEAASGSESEAQPQQDQSSIESTLQNLGTMLEQQRDLLQSEPWAQPADAEPEAEPEPEPDLSFMDEALTPEQAAERLGQFVDEATEKRLKDALSPLQEQMRDLQINAASDQLISQYPEMGDPKTAEPIIDASRQLAQQLGKPELAGEPQIWELMYLATRAREQAAAEGAESPEGNLEGAGGASPGAAGQDGVPTTQDVTASWRNSSLPLFRGAR